MEVTLLGLTQAELNDLFIVRDGKLYNKVTRHASAKAGTEAGYLDGQGYRLVTVNHKTFGVHRAIFFLQHGYVPEIVDHINGDITNNCICNLRAAVKSGNTQNAKLRSDSSTGVKGVKKLRDRDVYVARVQVNKRRKFLGSFKSLQDAEEFIELAREMVHGAFANHGTGCIAAGA